MEQLSSVKQTSAGWWLAPGLYYPSYIGAYNSPIEESSQTKQDSMEWEKPGFCFHCSIRVHPLSRKTAMPISGSRWIHLPKAYASQCPAVPARLFPKNWSWLVVTGTWILFVHSVGNKNHPNWRTHNFSEGVGSTTNQGQIVWKFWLGHQLSIGPRCQDMFRL